MKKIYIYTLSSLLLWGAAGCKRLNDFGKTNLYPDGVTVPIPKALLSNVMASLGGYASTGATALPGAQYSQYISETQYPGTSLYTLPQAEFVGYYNGPLYDLQTVINLNPNKNDVAVAKILQSYIYWNITDAWGDLPYSQALKGLSNILPAYDTQETIYKGILSTLGSAVASMDGGAVEGDLFYGGDAAKWKRAANSIRMMVALQLSAKVPSATDYAATAFKEAMAGGYIQDNSQNLTQPYNSTYKNPWWGVYSGRTDYGESNVVTDMTAALKDGRTDPWGGAFLDPGQITGGTETSNVGFEYGLDRNGALAFSTANPNWALVLRADMRVPGSPIVVLGAAELTLAVAEAINIGWVTGDLNATYQQGIRLSFAQWGVDAPSATYFNQAAVKLDPADGAVAGYDSKNAQAIATQQWLAAYPDGHLGWDIWRKTGWPSLTPAASGSGDIVRRFVYGIGEFSTNKVNVNAAIAREPGGKDLDTNPVWWDMKYNH